jgi:hypothetical protein
LERTDVVGQRLCLRIEGGLGVTRVVVVLLAGDGLIVAGINDGVDGVVVRGGGGTAMLLPIEERS